MRFDVITLFPELFEPFFAQGINRRAFETKQVDVRLWNPRDFADGNYRRVDDRPFGGGPGMVMKPQPFFDAVESIGARAPIVLLSPRGKVFTHADAERFSAGSELTLLCGHYKDVDQRVADHLATEELSLGDFVLTGGEPAALVVIDATVRLLPGAMSDQESARTDSFFESSAVSAPSYTRPPDYRGFRVPDVLISGDHKKIAEWRKAESERRSRGREG